MRATAIGFNRLLCLLCLTGALGACGTVAPWEKGQLAQAGMRLDQDRLEAKFDEHIYSSKEGAAGGGSVGGGGCGCN